MSAEPLMFPSLAELRVVVVGDVMLDRYWQGDTERISPEAPVPVLNVTHTEQRPGGAANVALNVVSLGAQCTLIGLVGDDDAGGELTATLQAAGVVCDFLVEPDWPTPLKLRLVAQRQQLLRADFEQSIAAAGSSERTASLLNKVEKHLRDANAFVIEDYDKGTIDDAQALIFAARKADVPVLVDPKDKPLHTYRGATVIKPNEKELRQTIGDVDKNLATQAQQLCRSLDVDGFVVTRGAEGLDVCTSDSVHHVPARQVEVYDVTGAGDTTVATLAIGVALTWPLVDSARIANVAASIAVSKSGTAPVSGPELYQALRTTGEDRGSMSREQLADAVASAKQSGSKIVFTNGCFDILHAGHVTYLQEAAALGDRLVVAVNDDESVARLKGPGRPVVPVDGRQRVLAGLQCVDWVVSFAEDTPESLLQLLQPDVLVKGGDYGEDQVVGADIVQAYGGEVRVLSMVADVSTTAIVERIRDTNK